ncbi:MAG TPA: carboxypeptidase-like regulatory domain-containing protein, partial [Terriglobia bacterium]|nr:carboxypeptidase-like regulatory domain-containing protein [Terriglobia bacterium]
MSAHRIVLTALLALTATLQSPEPPAKPALATVRGVVVDAASNLPVYAAVVELTGVKGGQVLSYSDVTTKDGKFEIPDVQPASGYELVASDPGNYRTGAYGQYTPNDVWTPITLKAGQNLTDVRIALTPISSIGGKVTDASGKGVGRAQIYALRATYSGGRRVLQLARQAQTADNGDFFMGGLESGQYYVRTNPSNSADYRQLFESPAGWDLLPNRKEGEPEGYPTYYFPGTMDLAAAKPVDLLNGGKARDINIRVAKIRTHRVTGTVLAEVREGTPAQPAAKSRVLLLPRSAGSESNLT